MNIKSGSLVLEIGSGDNPKPRSDVLCDRLPEDNTQRGGNIVRDRPFIACDGQYLPFADRSFDYIICCHVLEHVDSPSLFMSEMTRVGKAGYIETPSEIGEKLYGWEYHKWLINLDNSGKLVLKRKKEQSQFGQLFHQIFLSDQDYAKFHNNNHNIFLVQYEWTEKIDYRITNDDEKLLELDDTEQVKALLSKRSHIGASNRVGQLIPSWVRRRVKGIMVKGQGKDKKTLKDIQNIIVCPLCKGQLLWNNDSISCNNCKTKYPIKDGIPFLLSD